MRKFLILSAISSMVLIPGIASATVFVTEGGAPAGDGSGLVSAVVPTTTYNFDTTVPAFTGLPSHGEVVSGSLGGQFAAPFGDTTSYYTVGTLAQPESATLTVSGKNNYIGLYWGSIDTYNSITITDSSGSTVVNSSTFTILNPANGDQGLGGSAYVNIFDTLPITSITFSSNQQAFEFDNLTVAAAAPEPATWAMMVLGFFGVGFLAYRRKSMGRSFRVA